MIPTMILAWGGYLYEPAPTRSFEHTRDDDEQ